jgi:hypothetical protein
MPVPAAAASALGIALTRPTAASALAAASADPFALIGAFRVDCTQGCPGWLFPQSIVTGSAAPLTYAYIGLSQ